MGHPHEKITRGGLSSVSDGWENSPMSNTMPNAGAALWCALAASLLVSSQAAAQAPVYATLPPVTVTAQKEPEDPQNLPLSVTAILSETLLAVGVRSVSDAGAYAPNVFFNEFTARKL